MLSGHMLIVYVQHRVGQSRCYFHCYNFGKWQPILIILALLNSGINHKRSWNYGCCLSSNQLLHYLVTF